MKLTKCTSASTQKILTLAISVIMFGLHTSSVRAQDAIGTQTNSSPIAEEVIVTGQYQKSLQSALEQKRNSNSIIEAISAEDIGQLPDVSITESLARLPGVAQDRDRGNGSQISIRGMGGLLSLTTLNGREIATVEEDRNIRYDQFPSELINAAQVYKTPQAKLTEGGVSGTVNLETISPIEHGETTVALSARGSIYDLGQEVDDAANSGIGHRLSASYIDTFNDDTLGLAVGIAQQTQPIATQRTELWNYGDTWHNKQWNDAAGININAPWGGQALTRGGEDSRIGVMGVVEWMPQNSLTVSYDVFYSKLDIEEEQRGFDFQIDSTYERQWAPASTAPTAYSNSDPGTLDLISGRVGLSSLRNLNEEFTQTDNLISHGLNVTWETDEWIYSQGLAYSKTQRDRRWYSVRTANNTVDPYGTFGVDTDGRMLFTPDAGISLTDITQNTISDITIAPLSHGEDSITSVDFSITRNLNGVISAVTFGGRYSDREKFLDAQLWDQFVTSDSSVITQDLIESADVDSYWNDLPQYLTLNRQAVVDFYFGGLENPAPNDNDDKLASWKVNEAIFSVFLQADIDTELAGLPLSGNVGVRYVNTETLASGHQILSTSVWVEEPAGSDNWVEMPATPIATTSEHSYDELLPSLNLILEVIPDHIVRMAVAKTIARAPLDFLSPSVDIGFDQWGDNPGEAGTGNPKLEPFRATQVDFTYEWYFNDSSSVATTLYYKDMETFIARQAGAKTITVEGTDYDLSLPVNGSGGYIRGYELMYQQAFDFLPGPLNGLGVYANYAFTESNITQGTPLYATPFALTGLSEHVGTVTLWHYLNGFETRISYSYRSEFQRDVNRLSAEEGINDDEGYADLSLSYTFENDLKIMFQAQNITDSPYKMYGLESNSPTHANRYELFGKRFSLGISYKF